MQKEVCQALRLFAFKCRDKKAAFHYPLTMYLLAIANPSGIFYQPTAKYLFRNQFVIFKPLSYCFKNWRNSRNWCKGLVSKVPSVVSNQTSWYNKRTLRKSYSVPREFSWIENYILKWAYQVIKWLDRKKPLKNAVYICDGIKCWDSKTWRDDFQNDSHEEKWLHIGNDSQATTTNIFIEQFKQDRSHQII